MSLKDMGTIEDQGYGLDFILKRCPSLGKERSTMKEDSIIIAIDHGYGRVKTAHGHFQSGVTLCEGEPFFVGNTLYYKDRYYIIGEEHKAFLADKIDDPDYYLLTLAAIARGLKLRNRTEARVHLAVGLPLAWVGRQKEAFVEGIMQRLREHEYNPEIMRLYIVGGGGCLVKNFGRYDAKRVTINDDICATAKGYEALALAKLRKAGRSA